MSEKCKHDLSYCGICSNNKPDIKSYDPVYVGEIMTECEFNDGDWYNKEDADTLIESLQQRNAELEAFVTSITDIYGAIQDDCIMEIVKSAQSLTNKEGE